MSLGSSENVVGRRCPICGSVASRVLYRFDRSRWIPGVVVRCADCRALFKQPSPPFRPLSEYYDSSYAASDYWDNALSTRRALVPLLRAITRVAPPAKSTLLDIGCGPGSFLELASAAGYRVTGLEINPLLADRARRTNGVEVIVGDTTSATLDSRRFDVITALDLIEHLLDPVDLIMRCADMLLPGGHLAIYTPNHSSVIARTASFLFSMSGGRIRGPVTEIFDGLHVVFFDRRTLRLCIEKAPLQIVETMMIKYDPARSNQAGAISAAGLRLLESVSPIVNGQFRIFLIARKVNTV